MWDSNTSASKLSWQWKQRQRARPKIHGAWSLLQFHCFMHKCCLVLVQLFRHLFTSGEVLPYWPVWRWFLMSFSYTTSEISFVGARKLFTLGLRVCSPVTVSYQANQGSNKAKRVWWNEKMFCSRTTANTTSHTVVAGLSWASDGEGKCSSLQSVRASRHPQVVHQLSNEDISCPLQVMK